MTITDPDAWSKWWGNRNPFTKAYTQEEIDFYGVTEYSHDGIRIETAPMFGAVRDYLNKAFHTGDLHVPMMDIDGNLWMSLTCMETQSQHLPIQFAIDHTGTAGLGMGHFTLRCMENPTVDTITVFERDARVIDFFKRCFGDRPGFDKVIFVLGDARETMEGYEFDFLYVDIYPTRLPDKIISDARLFLSKNFIEPARYHFWGRENVILDAINHGIVDMFDIDCPTQDFLRKWFNQPVEGLDPERMGRTIKLSGMYEIVTDARYCEEALEAIDFHEAFL